MSTGNFILKEDNRIIFIEVKGPDHPNATEKSRKQFEVDLRSDAVNQALARKCRDTFIYQWAAKALDADKNIHYYVPIAKKDLERSDLPERTKRLCHELPSGGPLKQDIVGVCIVFNMDSWEKCLPEFGLARIR